jgi:hypothetical protein
MDNVLMWHLINMSLIALMVFVFFMWYFRGFIIPYAKVRTSRGAKVLLKIRNPLVDYYTIGRPEGKVIKTKLRNGGEVTLSIPSSAYYRTLGVVCCDVDEESGAVVTREYNIVSTHDPITINNIMVRQKTAPQNTRPQQVILIILLVVVLLGVFIGLLMINGLKADIQSISLVAEVGGVNL